MTITQIISMKPSARAASIFNSLHCRNLPFTAWLILRQAGRANHPNRTLRDGHWPHYRSGEAGVSSKIDGVEHHKSHDRRGNAYTQHVTHIMPGDALARLLGRHHGALLALVLLGYGAVLRRAH